MPAFIMLIQCNKEASFEVSSYLQNKQIILTLIQTKPYLHKNTHLANNPTIIKINSKNMFCGEEKKSLKCYTETLCIVSRYVRCCTATKA